MRRDEGEERGGRRDAERDIGGGVMVVECCRWIGAHCGWQQHRRDVAHYRGKDCHGGKGADGAEPDGEARVAHGHDGSDEEGLVPQLGAKDHSNGGHEGLAKPRDPRRRRRGSDHRVIGEGDRQQYERKGAESSSLHDRLSATAVSTTRHRDRQTDIFAPEGKTRTASVRRCSNTLATTTTTGLQEGKWVTSP